MHNTRSFSTSTVDLRAHCWTMNAHAQHPFLYYFDCGLYSINKTQSPSAFRVAVSSSPSKSDSATPSRQTGRRSPGCHRRSYLSSSGYTAVLFLLFCFCFLIVASENSSSNAALRPQKPQGRGAKGGHPHFHRITQLLSSASAKVHQTSV